MSSNVPTLSPPHQINLAGHFATGTFTSLCNISLFHPLFTLKTLSMARIPINFRHLYAGYGANLVCDISNQGIAFCAFGFFENRVISIKKTALSEKENFVGGLFAGTIAAMALNSLERVMIIQQVIENDPTKKATQIAAFRVFKSIVKIEGYRGLVRGIYPTIAREAINSSCFFGLSKMMQKQTSKLTENEKLAKSYSYLVAGATAGFLTTPFDLIKTRLQKDISIKPRSIKEEIVNITEKKLKKIPHLFTGGVPRVIMLSATMLGMGFFSEKIKCYLPQSMKDHIDP